MITTNIDYRILRQMDEFSVDNLLYTIKQECYELKAAQLFVQVHIGLGGYRADIFDDLDPSDCALLKSFKVSHLTGLMKSGSVELHHD